MHCFVATQRLAVLLTGILAESDNYLRPSSEYPRWARHKAAASLQQFPLTHKVAFLDLASDAQQHILRRLRNASRMFISAEADKLRNDFSHPRSSPPNLEELGSSLETIKDTISELEADGFCRMMYVLERFEGDAVLREKVSLSNRRGYKYTLHLPSSYAWLRLPRRTEPQYVMLSARLGKYRCLRFTTREESPFSRMYDGYPKRPVGSIRERRDLAVPDALI